MVFARHSEYVYELHGMSLLPGAFRICTFLGATAHPAHRTFRRSIPYSGATFRLYVGSEDPGCPLVSSAD